MTMSTMYAKNIALAWFGRTEINYSWDFKN